MEYGEVMYRGQSKIAAIKAVRGVFGIPLKEAKDAVEGGFQCPRYDFETLLASYTETTLQPFFGLPKHAFDDWKFYVSGSMYFSQVPESVLRNKDHVSAKEVQRVRRAHIRANERMKAAADAFNAEVRAVQDMGFNVDTELNLESGTVESFVTLWTRA